MNFAEGSRIMNAAVQVLKTLGWAWRWAEWWVDYNSTWEPLLEPGQKESRMTKNELKIVSSTRDSRCADARKCRLAAFGAALRNRCYDTADGFNREAFDAAIRAVLHTSSLVGPLEDCEINFFAEWLGRAYRSKSRLLGFGDDRIRVSSKNHAVLHIRDQSQKYKLGNRPLPGSRPLQENSVFELDVEEIDDFMMRELVIIQPKSPKRRTSIITSTIPISQDQTEIERKKRRNERDRARRDRKRMERDAKRSKRSERNAQQPSVAAAIEVTLDVDCRTFNPSASLKRRGRPPRDRDVSNLLVPEQEKRRPGRPRRNPVPMDESMIGSEGVDSLTFPVRKRRDRSTGESGSDEDYVEESAPPPKRKRGRPPRDRSADDGRSKVGRPRLDQRNHKRRRNRARNADIEELSDQIDGAENSEGSTRSTNWDGSGLAEDYPDGNQSLEESHDPESARRSPRHMDDTLVGPLSKFDLVKNRRRQSKSTINVGACSFSKSNDVSNTLEIEGKSRAEGGGNDALLISDPASKRTEHLATFLPSPLRPASVTVPCAAFGPGNPSLDSSNVPTDLVNSTEQELLGTMSPDTRTKNTTDLTATEVPVAKIPSTKTQVDIEDTPKKRGRRRGKQQAIDQLSLTLSQIKRR